VPIVGTGERDPAFVQATRDLLAELVARARDQLTGQAGSGSRS
jgi:hypothetical protein